MFYAIWEYQINMLLGAAYIRPLVQDILCNLNDILYPVRERNTSLRRYVDFNIDKLREHCELRNNILDMLILASCNGLAESK